MHTIIVMTGPLCFSTIIQLAIHIQSILINMIKITELNIE
jgi:hypothetical protein